MNLVRINAFYFPAEAPKSLAQALRDLADHLEAPEVPGRHVAGVSTTVTHDSARYNASLGWRVTAQAGLFKLGDSSWLEISHGVVGARLKETGDEVFTLVK